ncbi:two-component system response regulator YesN [Gracilibacillus halotolerans]|uniref:Two-component system response regulator YesN n=1 Tax=Gracilibacillus halotolerans TaxID=74386 RepID=A0A841RLI4_9BACI|nr:response regulator transcription factor [Gracilibacillus halotolerans]MBB6512802.1 two-component system response regulator YesN [Gracilibacillus halotolerans]
MNNFYTVLVVDDEMLIRQGIIHYVDWETNGYQIVGEAANGKEAIKKIEQLEPQILLTDIVMPSMDGIELIQFVKKHYPAMEIIVLSSYEEFDYVRKTFQLGVADYILKPKLNEKEILTTLDKLISKRTNLQQEEVSISMDDVVRKLIHGYQTIREFNYLRDVLQEKTISLIEVFTKPDTELHLSKRKLCALFERMNLPISVNEISIENYSKLFLLYTKEQNSMIEAQKAIEKISGTFKMTIGEPFSETSKMKEIYEAIERTKRFHFFLPDKRILYTNHLPNATDPTFLFDFNHFTHLVKHRQIEQAYSYINEYIENITETYAMEVHEFQSWLGNICFNMIVLVDNMDLNTEKLEENKYNYLKKVNDAFDVQEAVTVYQELIAEVKELLLTNVASPPMIEQLLQYIDENYQEPLTLEDLANHFHFNPSYLSSYFSKQMNQGFNEYLHKTRIEQAKNLLKKHEISISSISEKIGYSDPSYFTKVFKKMEGISPRQYRRKVVDAK